MGKTLQIAQDLGLLPQQDSESFDESKVELTDDEKEIFLSKALRVKRTMAYTEFYNRKLLRLNIMPKLSAEDLMRIVIEKGRTEISDFNLSSEQALIYLQLSQYFTQDSKFDGDLMKGLMITGGVGCGKTTMMNLFSQNPKASYVVKSCRKIASEYADTSRRAQESGNTGENILHKYAGKYHPTIVENDFKTESWGLCFDDLGTEDVKANFKNQANVMEQVLLNRYDKMKEIPFRTHVTTNLNADQIGEYYGERVRSRMREMFNIIEIKLPDLRK